MPRFSFYNQNFSDVFRGHSGYLYIKATNKVLEQISKNIVNLAIKLKRNCDVLISGITARNNQYQKKAADVNRQLKEKCREKKLHFLDHGNTITVRHLNASKFYLNKRGTQVLSNVFAEAISNITN